MISLGHFLGIWKFLFKTDGNPYRNLVLKQGRSDQTMALLAILPSIASGISQGADAIYRKLLIAQFTDYEERYGCTLLARINDEKKAALICVTVSFMLYTFLIRIAATSPEQISAPLTAALHFDIYHEKPKAGTGSFLDYMIYQNPKFEDPKMAPAFKFGNEIAQIMETMDMAFSFMASQQAILISEITRKILDGLLPNQTVRVCHEII